jgi:hypothetical protein
MSRRSRQANKEKTTRKQKPKADMDSPPKKPFALLRRRRVLLAALAGLLTMILIAVLGGRQPPRITVVNKTGEPLTSIKFEFPGGSVESDPVPDEGKASVLLRPDPANPKRPGSGPVTLTYRVGNGPPNRFMSRVHGQDYGAHDIVTIARQPDGSIVVTPSPPGGWGISFRDLLRRVGIRI